MILNPSWDAYVMRINHQSIISAVHATAGRWPPQLGCGVEPRNPPRWFRAAWWARQLSLRVDSLAMRIGAIYLNCLMSYRVLNKMRFWKVFLSCDLENESRSPTFKLWWALGEINLWWEYEVPVSNLWELSHAEFGRDGQPKEIDALHHFMAEV